MAESWSRWLSFHEKLREVYQVVHGVEPEFLVKFAGIQAPQYRQLISATYGAVYN